MDTKKKKRKKKRGSEGKEKEEKKTSAGAERNELQSRDRSLIDDCPTTKWHATYNKYTKSHRRASSDFSLFICLFIHFFLVFEYRKIYDAVALNPGIAKENP